MRRSSCRQRSGFTLIELLVVIAIIAILIALLVPAVQKVREAAARTQCLNNLKQLGIGLHAYHDVNKAFPPARTNAAGAIWPAPFVHNWTVHILPYIEQKPLYDRYRFDKNWDDAATNDANPGGVNQTVLSLFLCPSAPGGRLGARNRGIIDYDPVNQVTRPNPFVPNMPASDPSWIGILGLNVRRPAAQITDGTSNTMIVAESAGRNQTWRMGKMVSPSGTTGAWANPNDVIVVSGFDPTNPSATVGPCGVNCTNANEIYAFHTGLANVLFADGSVRSLRAGLDVSIVVALTTRSIGETLPPGAFD
jgi:prepilin-type N-terminal cleavage/methylation domain-containing protein/prepilin-type processing-associated H-X9-DG protein